MSDIVSYFRDENMERLEHSISEARGMTKTRWGSVVQTDLHQAVEESREGTPKISWSR